MRVQDVMRRAGTVDAGMPIPTASAVLAARGDEVAPVADSSGRLVGVVTRGDLAGPVLPNGWQLELDPEAVVAAVMTHRPVVVRPGDDLGAVVSLMRTRALPAVAVGDGARVVGVLLLADAARAVDPVGR